MNYYNRIKNVEVIEINQIDDMITDLIKEDGLYTAIISDVYGSIIDELTKVSEKKARKFIQDYLNTVDW